MVDIARLTGWQLRFAIERAVKGDKNAIARVLGSGYRPSDAELKLLADYHASRIKRPAHRPKSNESQKANSNPVLWLAVDFVEQYKKEQRRRGRVKGVEREAVEKALAFIATKGGAPMNATEKEIIAALDFIGEKTGYRLTECRLVNRLRRPRPKKRT